ncbi:MAG: tetratricopeptide repeat protein [Verrucomicrobia bacterium]|nr:tetratricopeptide repeat protein [Verrucomicrobiota bacterium]
MIARTALAISLVVLTVGGCRTTPVPEGHVRDHVGTAEYYLANFYRSHMAGELYQVLAPASRARLTYDDFVLQRQREIAVPGLSTELSVSRVEAAVLNDYMVNERHHILYALQQVRYPYAGAGYSHYRLIRLHVVNVHDRWYVEPFYDARTQTVRFLPALKRDSLRNLYDQREEVARLVSDDLVALRLGDEAPIGEVATETDPLEIPVLTGDTHEIPGVDDEGQQQDPREKLVGRLEVGKLHFRSGHLDLAERAFQEALEIDPENANAVDYLDRVRKARELRKIRQDITKLLEQILEAESDRMPGNVPEDAGVKEGPELE